MIHSIRMALKSITSSKMRAFLTMLGIIIGVMALVVLVSLVDGATSSVTNTVESLGSDTITISISDDHGKPIRTATLREWMEDGSIGYLAPGSSTSVTGKYGTTSSTVTVYGTTPVYYNINSMQLILGRFLKQTDVDNASSVCVLTQSTAEEMVGYADCVGDLISLDGRKFTIVGILEDDTTSLSSRFKSSNLTAYIPYTTYVRMSTTDTDNLTEFYASAPAGGTVEATENRLTELLLNRFEEDEDAFSVSSTNVLEDAMSSITGILSVLLGGIAAISLVVGGIGIMNIMMVTVTERTREIGIRKAIGASHGVILRQFLVEAVIICMMGCALGIFASWVILQLVGIVVVSTSITFKLNGTVVIIAVVFCFIIGIVFGLYPANKAAKMKPIDALHYGG